MNLYIYTDESGVFDKKHNDFFVFGGVLYLSKEDRDIGSRKYIHIERTIYQNNNYNGELKACKISNKHKGKIFRSLNDTIRFGVIVNQNKVYDDIFNDKKSKQRYLDYAYKMMIKKTLQKLDELKIINLDKIINIYIYCDEHTTATNGIYELEEGINQELKTGTYNYTWTKFYPPICKNLNNIILGFYDSKNKTLIRAADIVANRIYSTILCKDKKNNSLKKLSKNVTLIYLP